MAAKPRPKPPAGAAPGRARGAGPDHAARAAYHRGKAVEHRAQAAAFATLARRKPGA